MALVREIRPGSSGWNTIIYTDGTRYDGYTRDREIRHGLGTFYDADGSLLQQGEWLNDEFSLPLEDDEFNLRVNQSMHHTPHW